MAIARRGTGTGFAQVAAMTTGATSVSISKPTSAQVGDVLVCVVWGENPAGAAHTITGFTQQDVASSSTVMRMTLLYRIVDGTEGSSFTINLGASTKVVATMLCYSGVDTASPFSADNIKTESSANTAHTTNSLTPGSVDDWLLAFFGDRSTTSSKKNTNWTPTSPLVETAEVNNNTAGSSPWLNLEANDENAARGSTSAVTRTSTSTISQANAMMLIAALKPTPPDVHLSHYRFRNDDGSETGATWKAALDTNPSSQNLDETFRLRVAMTEEAGGNPPAVSYSLQYRVNGGSWANVATSGQGALLVASPNFADLDATTQQITSGSFLAGFMFEANAGATRDLAASQSTEFEYALRLNSALVSAGDTVEFSLLDTASSTRLTSDHTPTLTAASSAQHVSVTPATETDSSQALDKDKKKTVTPAAETDTAQPLRRPKLTPAAGTNTAQPLSKAKVKTLTPATETDGAQALTRRKSKTLTPAAETDAAQALDKDKLKTVTPAAETDTAQAAAHTRKRTLTPAAETDAAQALSISHAGNKQLTPATETDTAQPLSITHIHTRTLTPATETDTAQTLTRRKQKSITPAVETDSAQPLARSKSKAVTPATEADAAQAVKRTKSKTVTPALEADAAQTLVKPIRKTLTPAAETDGAQALTVSHAGSHTIAPAAETDTAQPLSFTHLHLRTLTPAAETDTARPLTVTHTHFRTLTPATETGAALVLKVSKARAVTPAASVNAAQTITWAKHVVVTAAVELDQARPLTRQKRATLTATATLDQARPLSINHLGSAGPPGQRFALIIPVPRATAAIAGHPRARALFAGQTRSAAISARARPSARITPSQAATAALTHA